MRIILKTILLPLLFLLCLSSTLSFLWTTASHHRCCAATTFTSALTSNEPTAANHRNSQSALYATQKENPTFQHVLAILAMPYTSLDRIANERILETVLPTTNKLSIVLRCEGATPSVASLRRYVGEIYSQLWDCVMDKQSPDLPDVVVYPANLPNAAPESWLTIQSDLDCICSHDRYIGWTSAGIGRGKSYQSKEGAGGLEEHVAAVNSERRDRNLQPVTPFHVDLPMLEEDDDEEQVIFLDDDVAEDSNDGFCNSQKLRQALEDEEPQSDLFFGGAKIPSKQLFESVACGGTFDGLHFGHRKLLTLAVSSVSFTGRLLVGVTSDDMLKHKEHAEHIPKLADRVQQVKDFLHRLAPGMMNRMKVVPIVDSFGPPGHSEMHFDALVLSHETLETGKLLNRHRVQHLGLRPLTLLCTRRTEAHGMSSTVLRRLRSQMKSGSSSPPRASTRKVM